MTLRPMTPLKVCPPKPVQRRHAACRSRGGDQELGFHTRVRKEGDFCVCDEEPSARTLFLSLNQMYPVTPQHSAPPSPPHAPPPTCPPFSLPLFSQLVSYHASSFHKWTWSCSRFHPVIRFCCHCEWVCGWGSGVGGRCQALGLQR